MNISENNRKKHEREEWALYIPPNEEKVRTVILAALKENGHTYKANTHNL